MKESYSYYGSHSRSPEKVGLPGHPLPTLNQCDGCAAGISVDARGLHRMGKPGAAYPDYLSCQKDRYEEEEE